ncbi:hypothetical protein M758_2G069000 [Ceratodon purpureus]|nr:hypothetical protein M758_2G069000 [Ceratodon purpureus]
MEMYAKWGSNYHHVQAGAMGSMTSPNLHQKNTSCTDPVNSCAITIDSHIAAVEKQELESYTRRCKERQLALKAKEHEVNGRPITSTEVTEIERRIEATEFAERVKPEYITITHTSGATESVPQSSLPHSYKIIRNLLWIEHHPLYRTALAEWKERLTVIASRVERKTKRSEDRKNEIYNMIGFYSVFQGVLLTATSQSNYLHCANVGLPIVLSAFASLCTLVGLVRKFNVISGLEKTICSEEVSYKEAKKRVLQLKERGEAFRFSDFLENQKTSCTFHPKFQICGLRSWCIVPLAVFGFSVVFVLAHWLILCRPGPSQGGF